MKKKLLFISGILSLVVGAVGIFLPLLPTTPFLLLSTWCFAGSSERFYNYIVTSKVFGKYITDYREKKGITVKNKIAALTVLTCGIGYSFTKVKGVHLQLILAAVFIGVTWHILAIKTLK